MYEKRAARIAFIVFSFVSTNLPAAPSHATFGSWRVQQRKNPVSDSVEEILSLNSSSGKGTLVLTFIDGELAGGKYAGVRFDAPKYKMFEPHNSDDHSRSNLLIRFDGDEPSSQLWLIVNAVSVVPISDRRAQEFVAQLATHRMLYVQYDLYHGPDGVVDTFVLRGLADQMKADNLNAH